MTSNPINPSTARRTRSTNAPSSSNLPMTLRSAAGTDQRPLRKRKRTESPQAGPSLADTLTTAASILDWNIESQASCAGWASQRDVCVLRTMCKPEEDEPLSETTFQRTFEDACKALAKRGVDRVNRVEPFLPYELDKIHGIGVWKQSEPYQHYIDQVRVAAGKTDAGNTIAGTSTTSRSRGPMKPDLMIGFQVDKILHAVWVCEIKYITYRGIDKSWKDHHSGGLAQGIWYLYAINNICGATTALVMINGRFHRLLAVNGENGEPDVLMVEVVEDAAREELLDGFDEYTFGKDAIPNSLPTSFNISYAATEPGTPTFRLWEHLKNALEEAEERVTTRLGCMRNVQAHEMPRPAQANEIPRPSIQLRNDSNTVKHIVQLTETFQTAVKAVKKTRAGKSKSNAPAGGGAEDGDDVGREQGGAGDGDGGRRGEPTGPEEGKTEKGGQGQVDGHGGGNGRAHQASTGNGIGNTNGGASESKPVIIPPQHPAHAAVRRAEYEPEYTVDRYVEEWREGLAVAKMEPTTVPPLLEHVESDPLDEATSDADVDNTFSDISSDSLELTMDEVTKVMHQSGWKFKFVSPLEMDRKMREHSASRREIGLLLV